MNRQLILGLALSISLAACTEPGEMTGIGAAAGGVVGAGLGAIVGSQTGDAGAGVAIGAVAGAATGAAIGNALQAQDETIKSQDEAIERQQQMLAANQRELSELKRSRDDTYSNRYTERQVYSTQNAAPRASLGSYNDAPKVKPLATTPQYHSTAVTDKPIEKKAAPLESAKSVQPVPAADKNTTPKESGGLVERDLTSSATKSDTVASIPETKSEPAALPATDDCGKAAGEVEKADASKEVADKLFHYRRALRLCPDNALYHNLLGETYVSLNRNVDAEFEFREALKLDPSMQLAKKNLDALR